MADTGISKIDSFKRSLSVKAAEPPKEEPEKEVPCPTPTAKEMEEMLAKEVEAAKAGAAKTSS
eukprot:365688-Chlamydomonas_euryale.AAC.20